MGFFNNVSPEQKFAEQSQKRELAFGREQVAMQTGSNGDEALFYQQQNAHADLLRWEQDLDPDLDRLYHDLKNEYFNGDRWVPKVEYVWDFDYQQYTYREMRPLLNEAGVQMVISICRGLCSKNMIMTNLDKKTINIILRRTANAIVSSIGDNYDKYEFDVLDGDHITTLAKNFIYAAPYRALNNGERIFMGKITKEIHSSVQKPDEEGKGGKILGFI